MKPTFKTMALSGLVFAAAGLSACLSDSDDEASTLATFDASALLDNYGNDVIVTVYSELESEADDLGVAVNAFVAAPSIATLTTAQQAWIDTRVPWENSEAFLFGPVDNGGFDPRLDSWPVNRVDLNAVLAGAAPINAAFIDAQDDDRRGFHTIEYLLFDDGTGSRVIADIVTAFQGQVRRGQYVSELCADLADTAGELADAWRANSGDYVTNIVDAGVQGNTIYPSQKAALLELVNGMSVIADEVANGKLADPFGPNAGGADVTLVESQFSYNSIADFQDNIRGILSVYQGDFGVNAGTGLDVYVDSRDQALASRFENELNAAIAAIGNIAAPFRDAITNDRAAVQAAIDAVQRVFNTIENDIRPLINSGVFAR